METNPNIIGIKKQIGEDGIRANMFIVIIVLFMLIGMALNWALLYLVRFKENNVNFEQEMELVLATSILNLIFTVILVFGLFIVWRYHRWQYISHMDRVTYVTWLILTITTTITTAFNFWTFSNLSGTITTQNIENSKTGALWGSVIFTVGVIIVICIYAIRGYRAQVDNGLFTRSIKALKNSRYNESIQKY